MTENKNQIYYLSFVVKTSEEHPHYAQVDQAYVGCWVQTDTDEKAIAVARELIEEDPWIIEKMESCDVVERADFEEDEENLQLFDQAVEGGHSIVVTECPRYPVYFVQFAVEPNDAVTESGESELSETRINPVDGTEIKNADATVWILNETVTEDDDADFFAEDFWEGENQSVALQIAEQIVTEEGWKITETIKHWPFSYRHCEQDESLWEYYEAAETDGICLVIWDQTEE